MAEQSEMALQNGVDSTLQSHNLHGYMEFMGASSPRYKLEFGQL